MGKEFVIITQTWPMTETKTWPITLSLITQPFHQSAADTTENTPSLIHIKPVQDVPVAQAIEIK